MGKEEFIPQEPPNADYGQNGRADIQHRREQERDARVSTKTMARLALEMSHVHRLAALVTEKAELLKGLAIQRQSYQDELKEVSKKKFCQSSCSEKTENHRGHFSREPRPTTCSRAHCSWQLGDGSGSIEPCPATHRGTFPLSIYLCAAVW